MLLLALALAAQPSAPPPSTAAGHVVTGPTRAYSDQQRAALACALADGVWRCDPELLRAFNAEDTTTAAAPLGVSASVQLVVGQRPSAGASAGSAPTCVTAIHVEVTAASEAIVVDWAGAALTVDGRQIAVATLTTGAPLSSEVSEATHACLVEDDVRARIVTLEVPLRVGGNTGSLHVEATRRVVSIDQKSALALLDRPQALPPPDDPVPAFPIISTGVGAVWAA